jgi:hypothetical protein
MVWRRIGWLEVPSSRPSWWVSHAAIPTVISSDGSNIRLAVSTRDLQQRSSAAQIQIEVEQDSIQLVAIRDEPLLEPGSPGTFDESGVNITYCTTRDGELSAWYHGWFLRQSGGWLNAIGVAKGSSESRLARVSRAPVFDRSIDDPTSIAYPFWYQFPWGRVLFYCTYEEYGVPPKGESYSYKVKFAPEVGYPRSSPLLPHLATDQAQSRPTIALVGDVYRMFLSVKGNRYRIACSESRDGKVWKWSSDEWSLWPLGSGGEVEEVAYSYVFWHQGSLKMLYNGDRHGETGFGVAVWDD